MHIYYYYFNCINIFLEKVKNNKKNDKIIEKKIHKLKNIEKNKEELLNIKNADFNIL